MSVEIKQIKTGQKILQYKANNVTNVRRHLLFLTFHCSFETRIAVFQLSVLDI